MAKRFSPDYTVDDILTLYRTRLNDADEARLRTVAPVIRALCRMEHEIIIPKTYKAITKEVRTPFMRDSRVRIASSLVGRRPVVHITPKNEQVKEYREAASIAERWDTAFFDRANKETKTDLDFANAAALVTDGDSILKVVHRPDAWANFPEYADGISSKDYNANAADFKKGVDLPIAMRNLDRLCVLREGGEYGDEWILEYGEYRRKYLGERYSMREVDSKLVDPQHILEGKPTPEGLSSSTTGSTYKVEFWTPREWHVIIDGSWAPGFPKPNPYAPYIPYFSASAYEMESLLYSLMYLVPRMDEILTMKMAWSMLGSYPSPVITTLPNQTGLPSIDLPIGDSGDVGGAGADEQPQLWSPGKSIELPVGKSIGFLTPPAVGKDLNDLVVILKSLIDVAGVPSIMRGMSGAGDSGYLANQMLAAVQMSHQLAVIALQRQREQALEFSHWIVANKVKQTVYVQGYSAIHRKTGKPTKKAKDEWVGLGIEPDKNVADVNMLGAVTCSYRPMLPTDSQANAMIALQLTNSSKPLYGRRDALEKIMQEEDADGILDALWVEEALDSEPLKSQAIEAALRDARIKVPQQPASFVGLNGQELLGGMQQAGMQQPYGGSIPLNGMSVAGGPSVPGVNTFVQPPVSSGITGAAGGRAPGSYPGLPPRQ